MIKAILKSVIYFIAPILVVLVVSQAAHSIRPTPVFDFEVEYGFSPSAIGPGDRMELVPVITNTGNIDGFVSFKITQPLIPDDGTPLYIIEVNDPWRQKDEVVLDDYISTTYIYSVPLKPGESTVPLCDGAIMAEISLPTYANIEDINITINMYAEEAE